MPVPEERIECTEGRRRIERYQKNVYEQVLIWIRYQKNVSREKSWCAFVNGLRVALNDQADAPSCINANGCGAFRPGGFNARQPFVDFFVKVAYRAYYLQAATV